MADSLHEIRLQGIMVVALDICFDEYNKHDSLQARLTKVIGHFLKIHDTKYW